MKVIIFFCLVALAFAEKTCLEEPDEGMCRGYFESYYYDYKSRSCKTFVYGGCGGNGNRYPTEEDCMDNCGDVVVFESRSDSTCELPAVTGKCRAFILRYFFDKDSGECDTFVYGGCGGNENNFESRLDCESRCKNDVALKTESDSTCELPSETGVCRAYIPRYFFDKESGECKRFIYGGCGGNGNNFKTKQACESQCKNE